MRVRGEGGPALMESFAEDSFFRLTPGRKRAASHTSRSRNIEWDQTIERAWRDVAAIEEAFERGDIDEAAWHERMAALVVSAYLRGNNPRAIGIQRHRGRLGAGSSSDQ